MNILNSNPGFLLSTLETNLDFFLSVIQRSATDCFMVQVESTLHQENEPMLTFKLNRKTPISILWFKRQRAASNCYKFPEVFSTISLVQGKVKNDDTFVTMRVGERCYIKISMRSVT